VIINHPVAETTPSIPYSQLGQTCTVAPDDRCIGSGKKWAGIAISDEQPVDH